MRLPPRPEPLWRIADVAKFLRASVSWVHRAAREGTIPSLQLGEKKFLRFDPAAIRRWALVESARRFPPPAATANDAGAPPDAADAPTP